MKLIGALAAALTLVGRHGTLVAAASIFVGLAVPALAAAFKPYLGEAIVRCSRSPFCGSIPAELRRHWTRPGLIAAATVWAMLIVPAVLGMRVSGCSVSIRGCRISTSCWCCRCRRPA